MIQNLAYKEGKQFFDGANKALPRALAKERENVKRVWGRKYAIPRKA